MWDTIYKACLLPWGWVLHAIRRSRYQELPTSDGQLHSFEPLNPRHHRRRWTWAILSRDLITSLPASTTASLGDSAVPLSRFNMNPENAIVSRRNLGLAIGIYQFGRGDVSSHYMSRVSCSDKQPHTALPNLVDLAALTSRCPTSLPLLAQTLTSQGT